jgi:hypothetical protein
MTARRAPFQPMLIPLSVLLIAHSVIAHRK